MESEARCRLASERKVAPDPSEPLNYGHWDCDKELVQHTPDSNERSKFIISFTCDKVAVESDFDVSTGQIVNRGNSENTSVVGLSQTSKDLRRFVEENSLTQSKKILTQPQNMSVLRVSTAKTKSHEMHNILSNTETSSNIISSILKAPRNSSNVRHSESHLIAENISAATPFDYENSSNGQCLGQKTTMDDTYTPRDDMVSSNQSFVPSVVACSPAAAAAPPPPPPSLSSSSQVAISSSSSPSSYSDSLNTAHEDRNQLTNLSHSLLQQLTAVATAVNYDSENSHEGKKPNDTLELRQEKFSSPPVGKLQDPETYGINLSISGELVSASDVRVWEFPNSEKLYQLRHRLVSFMRENHLRQADICRFTGLSAPYLSFMVKDPTIPNFASRRRVEVFSMLSTFFRKIDTQQITMEDISKLVFLSKAAARASYLSKKECNDKTFVIHRRSRGRPKASLPKLEHSQDKELAGISLMPQCQASNNFTEPHELTELHKPAHFRGRRGKKLCSHPFKDTSPSIKNLPELKALNSTSITTSLHGESLDQDSLTAPEPLREERAKNFSVGLRPYGSESSPYSSVSSNVTGPIIRERLNYSNSLTTHTEPQAAVATAASQTCLSHTSMVSGKPIVVDALTYGTDFPKHQHVTSFDPIEYKSLLSSGNSCHHKPGFHEHLTEDSDVSLFDLNSRLLSSLLENLIRQNIASFKNQTHESESVKEKRIELNCGETSTRQDTNLVGQVFDSGAQQQSPAKIHSVHEPHSGTCGAVLQKRDITSLADYRSPSSSQFSCTAWNKVPGVHDSCLQPINREFVSSPSFSSGIENTECLVPCLSHVEHITSSNTARYQENSDVLIHFGKNWLQETNREALNTSRMNESESLKQLSELYTFSTPCNNCLLTGPLEKFKVSPSENLCVIQLVWDDHGRQRESNVVWNMDKSDDLVDSFLKTFTETLGLPHDTVGVSLSLSFHHQLDSARSFHTFYHTVCRHLLSRLGKHQQLCDLPGLSRKILLDFAYQNVRLIDVVFWNLANHLGDGKALLEGILQNAGLPTILWSKHFPTFIRAVYQEKLKFVQECNGVVLKNIYSEINYWRNSLQATTQSSTASNQTVSIQSLPNQVVRSQTVPNQTVSSQAVSNQTFSSQPVPSQNFSTQTFSSQPVPNQIFSSQNVSSQGVLNQTVPSHTVPSHTVPSQTFSSQTFSSQAVPNQTVSSQTAPNQTFSSQAVPNQTVSSQAVPCQTVPSQAVPNQTAPSQTVPSQTVSSQTASSQTASSQSFSIQTFSSQAVPSQTLSSQTVPNQTVSSQTVPNQTVSSQTAPNQTFSSQTFSSQTFSSQAASNQTLSSQTAPNQTFSSQAAPNQTLSSQAVPNQTFSSQAVPNQTLSIQTAPNQTFSSQTFSSQAISNQAVSNQTFSNQIVSSPIISSQATPRVTTKKNLDKGYHNNSRCSNSAKTQYASDGASQLFLKTVSEGCAVLTPENEIDRKDTSRRNPKRSDFHYISRPCCKSQFECRALSPIHGPAHMSGATKRHKERDTHGKSCPINDFYHSDAQTVELEKSELKKCLNSNRTDGHTSLLQKFKFPLNELSLYHSLDERPSGFDQRMDVQGTTSPSSEDTHPLDPTHVSAISKNSVASPSRVPASQCQVFKSYETKYNSSALKSTSSPTHHSMKSQTMFYGQAACLKNILVKKQDVASQPSVSPPIESHTLNSGIARRSVDEVRIRGIGRVCVSRHVASPNQLQSSVLPRCVALATGKIAMTSRDGEIYNHA